MVPASVLFRLFRDCTALREVDLVSVNVEPQDWSSSDIIHMKQLQRFDMHTLQIDTKNYMLDRLTFPPQSTQRTPIVPFRVITEEALPAK